MQNGADDFGGQVFLAVTFGSLRSSLQLGTCVPPGPTLLSLRLPKSPDGTRLQAGEVPRDVGWLGKTLPAHGRSPAVQGEGNKCRRFEVGRAAAGEEGVAHQSLVRLELPRIWASVGQALAFLPIRARRLDDGQPLDARVGLVDELDVAVVAGVSGCQRGGRVARLRRRFPHTSGVDARLLVRVGEAQGRLVSRVGVNVEVGHGKLAGRGGAAGSQLHVGRQGVVGRHRGDRGSHEADKAVRVEHDEAGSVLMNRTRDSWGHKW